MKESIYSPSFKFPQVQMVHIHREVRGHTDRNNMSTSSDLLSLKSKCDDKRSKYCNLSADPETTLQTE